MSGSEVISPVNGSRETARRRSGVGALKALGKRGARDK